MRVYLLKFSVFFLALQLSCSLIANEQEFNRVYLHLHLGDYHAALDEAKEQLNDQSTSKDNRIALLHALSSCGEEISLLKEWEKLIKEYDEERENRSLLEVLAWGVLNKGQQSNQLSIRVNSLLGAALTRNVKAVDFLLAQLRDSNAHLRSMAVKLAAMYGDIPLQSELSRMVREEKVWYVRLEVIKAIGQLKIREFKPLLEDIIANEKTLAEEKSAATIALVGMINHLDRDELYCLARSNRRGLRYLACQLITYLDAKEHIDLLYPLLKDSSHDVRIAALNAIGLLRPDLSARVMQKIVENSQEPADALAITASWLLCLYHEKSGKEQLVRRINSDDKVAGRLAAAALAATGSYNVDELTSLLKKSNDPFIAINLSLGLIGQRKETQLASNALHRALTEKGSDLWMWDQTSNPLFRTIAPSQLSHVEQIPNYPKVVDQMIELDLLAILCMFDERLAMPLVKNFLQSSQWGISSIAMISLLQEGDDEALAIIKKLLNDQNQSIRVQAALVLSLVGADPSAIHVLMELYPEVDREMKVHILEAIAHVGDKTAVAFLLERMKEPFQMLRVVAASALVQCLN